MGCGRGAGFEVGGVMPRKSRSSPTPVTPDPYPSAESLPLPPELRQIFLWRPIRADCSYSPRRDFPPVSLHERAEQLLGPRIEKSCSAPPYRFALRQTGEAGCAVDVWSHPTMSPCLLVSLSSSGLRSLSGIGRGPKRRNNITLSSGASQR